MYRLATRPEDVAQAISSWSNTSILGLDTETRGLNWWRDGLVGISVATHSEAWYFPFGHAEGNLPERCILQLRDAIQGRTVVGANLNYDWHILRRVGWLEGLRQPPKYHDAAIAAYSLDENQPLKLEELASRYLGIDGSAQERGLMDDIAGVLGKRRAAKADKAEMWRLHPSRVAPYAGADALYCARLTDVLKPLLKKDRTWNSYLNLLEYQRALHEMEENGLPVDRALLHRNWSEARVERDKLREAIREASGGKVENPRSPVQLKEWLGLPDTSKDTLSQVTDDDRIYLVQDFRKWDKACGTYYQGISDAIGDGNVLHPSLRLTGAIVRLSASNPNTQAIPREGDKYKVKPFFGSSDPDTYVMEADLATAEIAMAAHLTKDPALVAAIRDGFDLHQGLADRLHELSKIEIPRQTAKMANFLIQYGGGAATLANNLRLPLTVAKALIAAHKQMYPGLAKAYRSAQYMFRRDGRVTLWSGRVRHRTDSGKLVKDHAASNNLIQGGVSEQLRVAIVRIAKEVPEFKMGLTVHDSIVGTHDRRYTDEISREVHRIMTDWPWMDPCTGCDIASAPTWALCKDKQYEWHKSA